MSAKWPSELRFALKAKRAKARASYPKPKAKRGKSPRGGQRY